MLSCDCGTQMGSSIPGLSLDHGIGDPDLTDVSLNCPEFAEGQFGCDERSAGIRLATMAAISVRAAGLAKWVGTKAEVAAQSPISKFMKHSSILRYGG